MKLDLFFFLFSLFQGVKIALGAAFDDSIMPLLFLNHCPTFCEDRNLRTYMSTRRAQNAAEVGYKGHLGEPGGILSLVGL